MRTSLVITTVLAALTLAGCGQQADRQQAAPADDPTASASAATAPPATGSASPRPSPTARDIDLADALLTAALLTAEDAAGVEAGVEAGTWETVAAPDDGPLLDPCPGGTAYPRDADRVKRASVELSITREVGGTGFVQQLASYRSAATATDAAAGYRRAVEGCPTKSSGADLPGGTTRHDVVDTFTTGEVTTVLIRWESSCPDCVGAYEYYAVQLIDQVVSVTVVGIGEDGDPGTEFARRYADVTARTLQRVVGS